MPRTFPMPLNGLVFYSREMYTEH